MPNNHMRSSSSTVKPVTTLVLRHLMCMLWRKSVVNAKMPPVSLMILQDVLGPCPHKSLMVLNCWVTGGSPFAVAYQNRMSQSARPSTIWFVSGGTFVCYWRIMLKFGPQCWCGGLVPHLAVALPAHMISYNK